MAGCPQRSGRLEIKITQGRLTPADTISIKHKEVYMIADILNEAKKEQANQEISLYKKMELLGVEHYSPSSISQFLNNQVLWCMNRIYGIRSLYPKPALSRGISIEKAVQDVLIGSADNATKSALKYFQHSTVRDLLKPYPLTVKGFSKDQIQNIMMTPPKEKFFAAFSDIIETHWKFNQNLPSWLDPNDEGKKIMLKLINEYETVESVTESVLSYFQNQIKGEKFRYQSKVSRKITEAGGVEMTGYTDFENSVLGFDLKTSLRKPKDFSKVSLSHKCQASFYANSLRKDWILVYASPLNSDQKKEIAIHSIKDSGTPKEIAKLYKEISEDGKGTTEPTVIKYLDLFSQSDYILPEPVKEIPVSQSESVKWQKYNVQAIRSMNALISSCNPDNIKDEIKELCFSNPESMMLDPHEKELIQEFYGLSIETKENEETA